MTNIQGAGSILEQMRALKRRIHKSVGCYDFFTEGFTCF